MPAAPPASRASGNAAHGESPSCAATKVAYAPIVRNAPCAKLMIFITPKISSSPAATAYRIAVVVRMSSSRAIESSFVVADVRQRVVTEFTSGSDTAYPGPRP